MRLLVDSHVFLWALTDPAKLAPKARAALASPYNEVLLSAVTLWELSLKYSLGKLDLRGITPDHLPAAAEQAGFEYCPLDPRTASTFFRLPKLGHKDPFDRLLVWQAICGGYTFLTKDTDLAIYQQHGLKLLWQ